MAKEWKTIRLASLWRSDITTTWKGNVSNHLSPRWRYWYVLLQLFYSSYQHDYIFSEYGTFDCKKTESFCSTLLKISYLLHENSLSYIHGIIELKNVHFDSYMFLYCNFYFCILIWYLKKQYNFLLSNTTIWIRTIR